MIFIISAASPDRIMGVSRRRADELGQLAMLGVPLQPPQGPIWHQNVENDPKSVDLERLLATRFRMVQKDAKSVDFERLLQPGLRMIENDTKMVDSERLLTAWAQNG